MTHITISKGLNIPIKGEPLGPVKEIPAPKQISLNLSPFEDIKFKLLVAVGDQVKIGQPLAEDKAALGRMFAAPAAGIVSDIRRGLKRRLLDIVIDVAEQEEFQEFQSIDVELASRHEIIERLKEGGIFSRILCRPFSLLADPEKNPKAIFVKAIESAPFTPSAETQVKGFEKEFQKGLLALSKLTSGKVHLVFSSASECPSFINASHVEKHTASGPHPIGTHSLHIQKIDPIKSIDDLIWTLDVHDVISIGYLLENGRYLTTRIISIAGPAILDSERGFYKVREGISISSLTTGKIKNESCRLISGTPLNGHKVENSDFLGFYDFVFCAIPESDTREFLHFFRIGKEKYSMSRAYLSGHLDNENRHYDFTTSLHGEPRPFIVSSLYDQVQPLNISTMLLVKAVMAEDFELAESLGLLEVAPEDFALPTFVCPSKMEMTEIMHRGLKQYAKEVLT